MCIAGVLFLSVLTSVEMRPCVCISVYLGMHNIPSFSARNKNNAKGQFCVINVS